MYALVKQVSCLVEEVWTLLSVIFLKNVLDCVFEDKSDLSKLRGFLCGWNTYMKF